MRRNFCSIFASFFFSFFYFRLRFCFVLFLMSVLIYFGDADVHAAACEAVILLSVRCTDSFSPEWCQFRLGSYDEFRPSYSTIGIIARIFFHQHGKHFISPIAVIKCRKQIYDAEYCGDWFYCSKKICCNK